MSEPVLHLQNAALMAVCMASTISCFYYDYMNSTETFNATQVAIALFSIADLYYNKSYELKIHHVFTLGIVGYNFYFGVDYADSGIIVASCFRTEMSTIFLILKDYLDKRGTAYLVNSLLFFALFLKFRIFDLYQNVICPGSALYLVSDKYTGSDEISHCIGRTVYYVSTYGLYSLNIYWFAILSKILYKTLFAMKSRLLESINSEKMCQWLCSYTLWFNVPICIWNYMDTVAAPSRPYLGGHLMASIILAVSSYKYHNYVYQQYHEEKITEYLYPDMPGLSHLLSDKLAIHLQSVATLVCINRLYNASPYMLAVSLIAHLTSINSAVNHMLDFLQDDKNPRMGFFEKTQLITIIPVGLDIGMIVLSANSQSAIPFMWASIWMAVIVHVQPFYKLNHFALHLAIIAQTYYACTIALRTGA